MILNKIMLFGREWFLAVGGESLGWLCSALFVLPRMLENSIFTGLKAFAKLNIFGCELRHFVRRTFALE